MCSLPDKLFATKTSCKGDGLLGRLLAGHSKSFPVILTVLSDGYSVGYTGEDFIEGKLKFLPKELSFHWLA